MLDADGGTRFLCQARPLQRDAKSFSATTMTKPQESIKLALGNLRQQYEDKGSAANSNLGNAQMRVDYIQFLYKIILGFFNIFWAVFSYDLCCYSRVKCTSNHLKWRVSNRSRTVARSHV